MILVTAAAGNQGKLLIPRMLAAGLKVRGCVRSEGSATTLRALGVEDVIVGDITRREVIARALRGVEKVYHVCPSLHPREREMGFAMIDEAKREGVKHFVFSSVIHAILTDLVQHELKRDVEEYLLSSGLDFTILQPAIYMLPRKLAPAFEHGIYPVAWSLDRRQSLVDLGDVSDVTVTVLKESEAHKGATYELASPGHYTAHDLGAIISDVLGRPIRVEQTDVESFLRASFAGRDRIELEYEARVVRSISERYSRHDFVGNPNVLTWLLGRKPTTFASFVATQYAIFRGHEFA